eukprot:scaffold7344_cov127-Isochrysis_galbana.AAC.8
MWSHPMSAFPSRLLLERFHAVSLAGMLSESGLFESPKPFLPVALPPPCVAPAASGSSNKTPCLVRPDWSLSPPADPAQDVRSHASRARIQAGSRAPASLGGAGSRNRKAPPSPAGALVPPVERLPLDHPDFDPNLDSAP